MKKKEICPCSQGNALDYKSLGHRPRGIVSKVLQAESLRYSGPHKFDRYLQYFIITQAFSLQFCSQYP